MIFDIWHFDEVNDLGKKSGKEFEAGAQGDGVCKSHNVN